MRKSSYLYQSIASQHAEYVIKNVTISLRQYSDIANGLKYSCRSICPRFPERTHSTICTF